MTDHIFALTNLTDPETLTAGYEWDSIINNERQVYVGYDNIEHGDVFGDPSTTQIGSITAQKASDGLQLMHDVDYMSGAVSSFKHFDWRFGRIDMLASVSAVPGAWAALWQLMAQRNPWSQYRHLGYPLEGLTEEQKNTPVHVKPELDIMELLHPVYAKDRHMLYGTAHTYKEGLPLDRVQSQGIYNESSIPTDPDYSKPHLYSCVWGWDEIRWYFDHHQYHTMKTDTVFRNMHMYLLANLAVGGNWPTKPVAKQFPATFNVHALTIQTAEMRLHKDSPSLIEITPAVHKAILNANGDMSSLPRLKKRISRVDTPVLKDKPSTPDKRPDPARGEYNAEQSRETPDASADPDPASVADQVRILKEQRRRYLRLGWQYAQAAESISAKRAALDNFMTEPAIPQGGFLALAASPDAEVIQQCYGGIHKLVRDMDALMSLVQTRAARTGIVADDTPTLDNRGDAVGKLYNDSVQANTLPTVPSAVDADLDPALLDDTATVEAPDVPPAHQYLDDHGMLLTGDVGAWRKGVADELDSLAEQVNAMRQLLTPVQ